MFLCWHSDHHTTHPNQACAVAALSEGGEGTVMLQEQHTHTGVTQLAGTLSASCKHCIFHLCPLLLLSVLVSACLRPFLVPRSAPAEPAAQVWGSLCLLPHLPPCRQGATSHLNPVLRKHPAQVLDPTEPKAEPQLCRARLPAALQLCLLGGTSSPSSAQALLMP